MDTDADKNSIKRRVYLITASIVIASIVIMTVIAGLFYETGKGVVLLKAGDEPYKIRPSDPGGLKLDNLDSPVLGLLDKPKTQTEREVLRPPESEPELPPITIETTPDSDNASESLITTLEEQPETPAQEEPQEEPEQEPEQEQAQEQPQLLPQLPPKDQEQEQVSGFSVQFAAFRKEGNAIDAVALLANKHKDRLNGLALRHVKEGKFWRVITEVMPRAEASALCSRFRSVGQDCIIKPIEVSQ